MQRRRLVLNVGGAMALGTLASCGFRLRGSFSYPFDSIFVAMDEAPQVGKALVRVLEQEGQLGVWTASGDIKKAKVVLVLGPEQFERVITAVTASGQVRELQIRIKVGFQMRDALGNELVSPSQVTQQRNVSYNETQALGKESEEARLYQDLVADVVQQLQRRLVVAGKKP